MWIVFLAVGFVFARRTSICDVYGVSYACFTEGVKIITTTLVPPARGVGKNQILQRPRRRSGMGVK